ncbi:MAG: substrate-binding domain-containing protein [Lachnospiraceae bacterium]|nr:substrate-binding domain-containing protein [Lachnospiraceae bacterium]MDE6981658.1 substrate-binding domain-containing protein [Lachnospiraceae bacterium]
MAKSIKMADIAGRLGVSVVTVSKALSGQKGVSDEMREKIKQVADELGYVRTVQEKSEQSRKSYTLGIIVAERFLADNQSFYWSLYQEVSRNAVRKSCFTLLEVISYRDEEDCALPKVLAENKADGLVIMGSFGRKYINYLKTVSKKPLVSLDSFDVEGEMDSVVSNNMVGAYTVTNHLFEMGHRNIGFVGTRLATASIDDRYFGYLKSLMEHGVDLNNAWILDDRDRKTGRVDFEDFFVLPRENMPTAFFCNCDLSANLMIRKLKEAGYRVPEDVSVAGFDHFQDMQMPEIDLTTYEINVKRMARRAVHILTRKIENPDYFSGMCVIAGKFIPKRSVKQVGFPVPFV